MTEEKEKAIKVLRQLRNFLTDDEDLKLPIHDEKFLIRFVRSKKYNAEVAHETVRKYYTLRQKNPKIFKNIYPSQELVKQILENNVVAKLKSPDKFGRAIVVWNTHKWDVSAFNMDYMLAALVLIFEESLFTSVDVQINGVTIIADNDSLGMQHVKECTPKRLKSFLNLYQGSFPLRGNGVHIVNQSSLIDIVVAIMRPFMTEKFKERMVFYGKEFEKLHQVFPTSILPEKLGGKLSEEDAYDSEFIKNLLKRDDYYKELLDYGYGDWESEEEDTYM